MLDAADAPPRDVSTPAGSLEVRRIKAAARDKLFGGAAPLQISRYTILRQLGVGGMGEVFLGYDAELGRKVAIKLVRLDRETGIERASSRLLREAQALARLSHPHVVQVYEVGKFEGRVFIAMEFVHGVQMRAWLEASPRSWREILDLYLQAGQGLAAAHRLGMVHRDFKPENVLVGDDGRVRVVDFGLVRRAVDPVQGDAESASAEDLERSSRLTQSGALMGTPTYMSPEQFQGLPATPKSDQFAFCVAVYRGLYGWHPFAAETRAELKRRVITGLVAPPPRDTRVPAALFDVLVRGLQADPERRFSSMEALLAALISPPRRRLRIALATAGAALAGALVAWNAWPDEPVPSCTPVAPAWDASARDALADAFARTDLVHAPLAADRVLARLDAHAAELRAEQAALCAAPDPDAWPGPQRRACLERRGRALEVLAAALAGADAALVERAAGLAEALPTAAACREGAALSAGPSTLSSASAEEARRLLAEARARELRGQYIDAAARSERAYELATRVRDEPLIAEARAALGRVALARGQRERGVDLLLDALDLAESLRHDELAAELWLTLGRDALAAPGDPFALDPFALLYVRRAAAAHARLADEDARPFVELLLGEVERARGKLSLAEGALRSALHHAGDRPVLRARAHLALGRVLAEEGQLTEAREHVERGLTLAREVPGGPDVPAGLEALADLAERSGRPAEAAAHLRAALELHAARPWLPEAAVRVHLELARLAETTGDLAAARAHAARVVALAGAAPGKVAPDALRRAQAWLPGPGGVTGSAAP